jgi:hypothetical protein
MTSHGRRASARTISNARASRNADRHRLKTREFLVAAAASVLLALALTPSAMAGVPLPRGAGAGTFLHAVRARPTGQSVEGLGASSLAPLVTGGNGETLQYWGGEVQHKPELDLLFWGNDFWNGTQPFYEGVSLYTEYKGFYDDLSNELEAPGEASWQGILSQYFGKSGTYGDAHVVGETDETAINAPQNITVENIKKEITTWVNRGLVQNPNTQVIVFTAPGTSFAEDPDKGCGYHGIDEQGYSYTFVAYAGDLNHYFAKNKEPYTCNYREKGNEVETTQLMWSSTAVGSHEFAESTTDPGIHGEYGWYSSSGEEIGDLCNHEPINSIELPEKNGRPGWWYVTELFDDGGGNTCKLEDPPYPPVPPPTVTTEPATALSAYQATLNAVVNPNGPEATYHFELGTTEAYGRNIPSPEGKIGYGSTPVSVSTQAASLTPNTTYHYRVVAANSSGTSRGADHTFTTPWPPPETKINGVDQIGPTIATLHGEVKAEYGAPRTWYFEYGLTTSYGSKTAEVKETSNTSWFAVSGGATGLAPKTLYHYRLTASTNGGTSHSADATFTTSASPQAVTEQPYGITAAEATLFGRVNPGGHETTYQFEYWPTAKSSEIKDIPATAESAGAGTGNVYEAKKITGLVARTYYTYRIRATNSLGTTYGEAVNFVAAPPFAFEVTPNPGGATKSPKLVAVSCATAALCMAVGQVESTAGPSGEIPPVAQHWNGVEWTSAAPALYPGSKRDFLEAVNCATATNCVALGYYENEGGGSGHMTTQWNGTSWTNLAAMPIPSEGTSVEPRALDCPTTSECMVVGSYDHLGQPAPMAERWTGSSWQVLAPPAPTAERAILHSVSCTSSSACTAVGSYDTTPQVTKSLIERWNGSSWTIQTSPSPTAERVYFTSVACTTASWCMAVGASSTTGSGGHALAEVWNGSAWSIVATPTAPGSEGGGWFEEVSCSSSAFCVEVGESIDAEWNGTEWGTQGMTVPSHGHAEILHGLSCPTGAACQAVGSYENEASAQLTLAEGLTPPLTETTAATSVSGGGATLNGTVNPQGQESTYAFEYGPTIAYGTKVPVPAASLAAGWKTEKVSRAVTGLHLEETAYHYRLSATNTYGTTYGADQVINPVSWAVRSAPSPSGAKESRLTGVACTAATACFGVGIYEGSVSGELLFGDRLTGTEWQLGTFVTPTGSTNSALPGVACSSASACTAVGRYTSSGKEVTLAERWNGSTWSIQTTPNPAGATSSTLDAVACPTSTSCTAVGYYSSGGSYYSLAEQWNGTEWLIESTPNEAGAFNNLTQVSCSSATACTAVGAVITSTALVVRWNGTSWTQQTPVVPTGAYWTNLTGVSCSGASTCVASGSYNTTEFGRLYALIETWNGTSWTIQSVPDPAGATSSGLGAGISCSSATACQAVGNYTTSAGVETALAEGLTGTTWSVQSVPMPSGATKGDLYGLSCVTVDQCDAVGQYTNSAGVRLPLVEESTP